MAAGVVFQLVTLPVEFDASKRAMQQIEALGIVSTDEYGQARKVLNAAALTYVAAAAVAVFELLRLVLIYTGMQRSDDQKTINFDSLFVLWIELYNVLQIEIIEVMRKGGGEMKYPDHLVKQVKERSAPN